MKYVVYVPENKLIIPCDKEDFFCEEVCAVGDINELSGSLVPCACIDGEDLYTKCYLLQVRQHNSRSQSFIICAVLLKEMHFG